jgi:hypothetical protein
MSIGVLFVVAWFVGVMLYLGWQFITNALVSPVHGQTVVDAPCEEGLPAEMAVSGPVVSPVSGAGVIG